LAFIIRIHRDARSSECQKQKYLVPGGSLKDTQNTGWKYERESSFGRTRARWYDAVIMYLEQLQWEDTDSVALASDKK